MHAFLSGFESWHVFVLSMFLSTSLWFVTKILKTTTNINRSLERLEELRQEQELQAQHLHEIQVVARNIYASELGGGFTALAQPWYADSLTSTEVKGFKRLLPKEEQIFQPTGEELDMYAEREV